MSDNGKIQKVDLFETARKVHRLHEAGGDDDLASEVDQEILAAAYQREEVDLTVRRARAFYFRHNPPNTMLAQLFNDILLANGTHESGLAEHRSREDAALTQPSDATRPAESVEANDG